MVGYFTNLWCLIRHNRRMDLARFMKTGAWDVYWCEVCQRYRRE